MIKMRTLFLFLAILISSAISAQVNDFWSNANENAIVLNAENERGLIPDEYQTFALDLVGIKSYLQNAPMERTAAARNQPLKLEFPLPDGQIHPFKIYESPVMMPGIAARYPNIKSFAGYSELDKSVKVRFVYSDLGFYAIFNTPTARYYIEPYAKNVHDTYIVYDKKNQSIPDDYNFICGVHNDDEFLHTNSPIEGFVPGEEFHDHTSASSRSVEVEAVELLEYKIAIAGVAEWTALHGGTVSGGMSAVNIVVNVLNSVFTPEAAIRFVLIDDNDQLIYTDASTDPYTNVTMGSALLQQNQDNLDMVIGSAAYDVGHVMTVACVDVGGIAGGTVCSQNGKGRGVTCQYSSNLNNIILDVAAHEVAHQFTAGHTWDNCEGTIGSPPVDIIAQRASGSAYEPGSGSTIMSYAGACGTQNVQFGSDHYFHVGSLQQIYNHSHDDGGGAGDCPDIIPAANDKPELVLNYENGFYIPMRTPFELSAIASDQNGDDLTYCWEQYNLGPLSDLGTPFLTAPSFRSYPPVASPMRVFPRLQSILQNTQSVTEVLPTYTRNLKFRCTVRDNNTEAGGVVWDEISFEATEQAGPFLVQYPNTNQIFEAGEYIEVLWDVANTDLAPVNCERVNIRFSSNGGSNTDMILAQNVPNDGAHFVNIPNVITGGGRIRVEATENIFFDYSNFNFQIIEATTPGYTLNAGPYYQQTCVPDNVVIDLSTLSLLDYDSPVSFSISGLPAGANPVFSANPILPSESATLTIETANIVDEGFYDIQITAMASGGDTIMRNVTFNLVLRDFSAITLQTPANGSSGVSESPEFTWIGSPNANTYDIEIATSPSFAPGTLLESATGLTTTSFTASTILEKNELYFWRIRPFNECGYGSYSVPLGFHTEVFECAVFVSDNVPLNISSVGTPTIESTLVINTTGAINDLNVKNLKGSHDLVKHLDVALISPDNTEVLLFSNACGIATSFNMGLDDEATLDIQCNGGTYKPQGNLSDFNNLNPVGIWTLKVAVNNTDGVGGALQEWSLELCSNTSTNPPYLVNNELMPTPPGGGRQITNNFLLSEDDDNGPEELVYTVVTVPESGTLFFVNNPMEVGMTFRQETIDAGNLSYVHNGGPETTDGFTFAVEDGEGGWFGTPRFEIEIDPNVVISTKDLLNSTNFALFPNPAQNLLNLRFNNPVNSRLDVYITNVQGQVLQNQRFENVLGQAAINTSSLSNGIYFLYVESEHGSATKKFVIQR
ncbi:MAG: subtilisin-like proprotein convertase family protein [Saprospiraceae bacterium]|jgi:subtilisin-like proprotein convertase family protein